MVSFLAWVRGPLPPDCCCPNPPPPRPLVEVDTVSDPAPSEVMLSLIFTEEPLPTATSRMTAPTPIRMPSVVRPLRSLLAPSPRRANRRTSQGLTGHHP